MSANGRTASRPALRRPVEQIWLAGLGALAVTEEEGSKLFRSLVKRGQGFEKESRARLDDVLEVTRAAPGNAITRIEEGMSDAFSGALHRLGVPTRKEIAQLTRRIEGLSATLERRTARPRRPATKARRTTKRTVSAPVTPTA